MAGSEKKIIWQCKKCKKEWTAWPYDRSKKDKPSGCPHCYQSHGEKRVESYLIKHNIDYSKQKTFNKCKDVGKLKFDFCLNIDNKILLIEYNGSQHYGHVREKYGKKTFPEKLEDLQRRDQIKLDYCEQNNIPFLVIPYWDFDKIEELILDFVKQQC